MRGGRRKLPVLAEIAGVAGGDTRAWSLRRSDLEALTKLQRGLDDHRAVLMVGAERLAAAIALAGCRRRRRPTHRPGRVRPGATADGGRAGPGPRPGTA